MPPAFLPPAALPPARRPRPPAAAAARRGAPTCRAARRGPTRRGVLAAAAAAAAAAATSAARPADAFPSVASSEWAVLAASAEGRPKIRQGRGAGVADRDAFTVYEVKSTEDVTLAPLSLSEALGEIGDRGVDTVFLGEHHHSYVDRITQARIVDALFRANGRRRPVAVGLEMVQMRFQPVLDAYVAREIDELALYSDTEWDARWVWPFEQYLPLFRVARNLSIPLLALSPDSELLARVRARGDLAEAADLFPGGDFRRLDVPDPAFQAYVNANILRSYAAHVRARVLQGAPSFNAFYDSRVVRDEAMAARADAYLAANPGGLLVSVLGIDHVKFPAFGVPGRLARRAAARADAAAADAARAAAAATGTAGPLGAPGRAPRPALCVKTVILNPTAVDAYNEDDGALMLDLPLGRARAPEPIADYLWFSSHVDVASKPRRASRRPGAGLPYVEELVNGQ